MTAQSLTSSRLLRLITRMLNITCKMSRTNLETSYRGPRRLMSLAALGHLSTNSTRARPRQSRSPAPLSTPHSVMSPLFAKRRQECAGECEKEK